MSDSPTASRRRRHQWTIMVLAAILHVGVFAALASNQALYDALFKGGERDRTGPGPDTLSAICEDLRQHHAGKWREHGDELRSLLQELEAVRAIEWQRVRERHGQVTLEQLQRLGTMQHVPVAAAADADQQLASAYEEVRVLEQRIHNTQIDVLAARNLLITEPLYTPIEAVSLVQVVAPERWRIDADVAEGDVRNRPALEAFRAQIVNGGSEIDAMRKHAKRVMASLDPQGGAERDFFALIPELGAGSDQGDTLLPDQLDPFGGATSNGPFNAVAGRHLTSKGPQNRNIFVDRWYVMGPFDNRLRRNLRAKFLPETGIDLNATTKGKDGRTLAWEYWVSDDLRIQPSHAEQESVYYGWTEIMVEEAGDYFVSLGSDDFGKLWINGEPVWESEEGPKSFQADEASQWFRLEAGVNQVLFRCENFGGTMGWSMVLIADTEGGGES